MPHDTIFPIIPPSHTDSTAKEMSAYSTREVSGVMLNPTGDFLHGVDCWRQVSHHQCAINLIEWQWDTIAKLRRLADDARAALADITATLRPVVDAADTEQHTCGSCGGEV